MLQIYVPPSEDYNEQTGEFLYFKGQNLQLEHSLISLAAWESKWKKPFLSQGTGVEQTAEETIDYIRCMTLNKNVDPLVYVHVTNENIEQIKAYIDDSMTATTFGKMPNQRGKKEVVTAEIIYYWMITLGIPIDFQKWHLNRLMTLIQVCNLKNAPAKRGSRKTDAAYRRELNAARRNRWNSAG